MKPEYINLILALLFLVLFVIAPLVIMLLRRTAWGRANRAELDLMSANLTFTQSLLEHNASALRTVVKAVELSDHKNAEAIFHNEPPLRPGEAVRLAMSDLEEQASPEVKAVWKTTVASVRKEFFAPQPASPASAPTPGVDDDPHARS